MSTPCYVSSTDGQYPSWRVTYPPVLAVDHGDCKGELWGGGTEPHKEGPFSPVHQPLLGFVLADIRMEPAAS